MSHVEDHEGHGHSVTVWVSTAVMLVASAAACYGMVRANTGLMVTGAVVFVLGALLWPLLSRLGYGDKNPPRSLYS